MAQVTFQSNGVKLAGDIYYPENYEQGKKYPAIIVTGAWTTVKGQMPTLYAKELAKKGFITMVFDFRGWGASDGNNRYLEDPLRKTADIVAAAAYLKTQPDVAANEVGGLGVCASSGYMVKAYSEKAFKAVALVAPWLHNQEIATQVYGGEESVKNLLALSDKAAKDFEANGELQIITAASTTDKNSLMYQAPYYTEENRGLISTYDNKFNVASWRPWLTFDAIQYADKIPGQVLFVESEAMALPQGSKAFKAIAGDKVESVNLPEVSQFDFYDKPEPVEKSVNSVAAFMTKELL
ncbi:alpha/beta hydrolase [Puteibacter caeruleilacunae]|nr:alpha/beta hydrolase [Puteibacter caeruleilacunae]